MRKDWHSFHFAWIPPCKFHWVGGPTRLPTATHLLYRMVQLIGRVKHIGVLYTDHSAILNYRSLNPKATCQKNM